MESSLAHKATAGISSPEEILCIDDVSKAFGNNQVLNRFKLKLRKGENVAILGKSGSGKSVLIKCVIGLLDPDSGSIRVFDQNVTELNEEEMDRLRVKIGFLFQSNALYDSMTVRENLEFPLRRHWLTITQVEIDKLVMEALDDVGLKHTVDMMPAELSGGMRKRIALARTLILKPEIILYDEPTTGLDPITGREICELMKEISEKYNTSSLIISHDLKCIKLTADRIAMLIEGQCYKEGEYREFESSNDPIIKQFFI